MGTCPHTPELAEYRGIGTLGVSLKRKGCLEKGLRLGTAGKGDMPLVQEQAAS